jgi:hypothetical protein
MGISHPPSFAWVVHNQNLEPTQQDKHMLNAPTQQKFNKTIRTNTPTH